MICVCIPQDHYSINVQHTSVPHVGVEEKTKVLETERLLIRHFELDDLDSIYAAVV